ncbi:MAG: LysM peptidoglycan-binding domain-containing protein [Lentisphaeria bacterium]|nr:LysM peptidoglycan-binding domain-containing protein [Lentisphaeria bacterium]
MVKFYAAAGAVLLVCAGCYQTDLANPRVSQEEQAWENIIRQSYPGYKAPQKTSRSFKGHTENRVSAVIVETPVKALDDPAPLADDAATEIPAVAEDPAEPAAETPAVAEPAAETPAVAEVKADKPAETPAVVEVKADKPAEAVKPADKPAESKPAAAVMPPDPTNSTVYVVKSGDTLGSIAQKTYGNARYSDVIFKANSDILKNPDKLSLGMKLIIPKL